MTTHEYKECLVDPLSFYRKIFRNSRVGMSVYNASGQCIEANEAIGELIGTHRERVLLQNYNDIESWKVSGLFDTAVSAIREKTEKTMEVTVTTSYGKTVTVACHFTPFLSQARRYLLLVSEDVTERKAAEVEQELLVEKLREALEHVRTLRGIIPICASCKKIRDDEGYWEQIETYVQKHSEADFSHGICPECAKRLYPDLNPYAED